MISTLPAAILVVMLSVVVLGVSSVPVMMEYGDVLEDEAPQQQSQHLRAAPQKKWDKYGMGFGSDGYLYDFVKRSAMPRFIEEPRHYGYGNGGYLNDYSKRAPRNPFYKKYRYGFGSDGYLYDFVKK